METGTTDDSKVLSYGREQHSRLERIARKLWRWTWRGVLALILIAIVVHTTWLGIATYQLNSRIEALKAAGEPVVPSDLDLPIPADNGYDDIQVAIKVADRDTAIQNRLDILDVGSPLTSLERMRIDAYVQDCLPALQALDHAATKNAWVPPQRYASPLINQLLPDLSSLRQTARLAGYAARREHDRGDDDAMFRRLDTIEPCAVAGANHQSLVASLVGVGIRASHAGVLIDTASEIKIGSENGSVSDEQMGRMIRGLLDSNAIKSEMDRALRSERLFQIDSLKCVDDGGLNAFVGSARPTPAILRYLQRPLVRSNASTCIDFTTQALNNWNHSDWPASSAALKKVSQSQPNSVLSVYAQILIPSLERAPLATYRVQTERHLAATALACRWYYVEHNAWPSSLGALVPKYLPALPKDPMASNAPIRANFALPVPIIWSVGSDGIDGNGDGTSKYSNGNSTWNAPDRVVELVRSPRMFDFETQRMMDLDLDSPISTKPIPQPALVEEVQGGPMIMDDITAFDVVGDTAAFPLVATRRDAFAMIAAGRFDNPEAKTSRPDQKLTGWIQTRERRWTFEIYSDNTGVLIDSDGTRSPFDWSSASLVPDPRAYWR